MSCSQIAEKPAGGSLLYDRNYTTWVPFMAHAHFVWWLKALHMVE